MDDARERGRLYLARRDVGDEVEFATIMKFDSIESVRAFAGAHFETLLTPEDTRAP